MAYPTPVKPAAQYEPLDESLISINTPVPSDDAAHMAYVSLAFSAVELALIIRDDQLRGINPEYIPFILQDRTYVNNVMDAFARNIVYQTPPKEVEVLRNGFSADYTPVQAQLSVAKSATVYPFDIGPEAFVV